MSRSTEWQPLAPDADSVLGLGVLAAFGMAMAAALLLGQFKVTVVSTIGCASMGFGALVAHLPLGRIAVADMLDRVAGGAMMGAACLFLLPRALDMDPLRAATGLAIGLAVGATLHRLCDRTSQRSSLFGDAPLIALTVHSAGAGAAIGMLYTFMPDLGLWLGVAIIAHKLPAGYALARGLHARGRSALAVAWPACAVGLAALPVSLVSAAWPSAPATAALCQGLSVGLFIHVSLDCATTPTASAEDDITSIARGAAAVLAGILSMWALRLAMG